MKSKRVHTKIGVYEDKDTKKTIEHENRRPIKNWTKIWKEHSSEYDLIEAFHKT